MKPSVWARAASLWLVILVLAILNGLLRERLLVPVLGACAGLVGSGVMLGVGIFLVAWLAAPGYGALSAAQWLRVGLFWLLLTLAFEIGFGYLVLHRTWADLLGAYIFRGCNLWPAVLVTTFLSPGLAARLRGCV